MPGRSRRQIPIISSLRATLNPISRGWGAPVPGPVRLEPSQPGAFGPEQGRFVKLPGSNFPPAGAIQVNEDGDADIAAGATATLVTIQVPDTQRFSGIGIGFGAHDETALKFLTWSVQANAIPQPGFIAKNAIIGSIPQLTPFTYVTGSSVTITIVGAASALAVVTYRYIVRVLGYFYTEETAQ
jgi:hypothetical protein